MYPKNHGQSMVTLRLYEVFYLTLRTIRDNKFSLDGGKVSIVNTKKTKPVLLRVSLTDMEVSLKNISQNRDTSLLNARL